MKPPDRAMVVRDPAPRGAFEPRTVCGVLMGRATTYSNAYWVYSGGRIYPRANVQATTMSTDDVAWVKIRLQEEAEPVVEYRYEELKPPDMNTVEQKLKQAKPPALQPERLYWECPPCRNPRSHKKHTKIPGECMRAPAIVDSQRLLPPPTDVAAGVEDDTPEEKSGGEAAY